MKVYLLEVFLPGERQATGIGVYESVEAAEAGRLGQTQEAGSWEAAIISQLEVGQFYGNDSSGVAHHWHYEAGDEVSSDGRERWQHRR